MVTSKSVRPFSSDPMEPIQSFDEWVHSGMKSNIKPIISTWDNNKIERANSRTVLVDFSENE